MKKFLIGILSIVILVCVGIGGFYFFQKSSYEKTVLEENKFPKNTKIKINDWETYVSYKNIQDVYNDYLNSNKKEDIKFKIKLKEKDYTIDITDCYENTIQLSDFENILNEISLNEYMFNKSIEFTLEDKLICNESKIKEKFSEFLNNTSYEYEEPQDAYFDEENYKIIESVNGTKIIEEIALNDFIENVKKENFSLDLDNEKYYTKANIQTEDIAEKYKELLSIVNWKATYSNSNYVISMKDYMNYVKQNEDGSYTIDTSFLKDAVLTLSKTIDNNKAHDRQFKSTLDGIITITGGSYNQIMDNEKEIEYLTEMLEKREMCENREPVWKIKPIPSGEEKTYVEVDLSAQHVWYYENGELIIEADCVTGTDNTSRETPTGSYYVSQMIKGTYLVGPTWRSWVDRWMRITTDGVGLHDAQWRKSSEFGGDTYKTNGSHGCINLPKEFAYEIYDKVTYGTLVIVHD